MKKILFILILLHQTANSTLNTLLLSYHISGSNWLSYCIENITKTKVIAHNKNIVVFTETLSNQAANKNLIVKKLHRPWLIGKNESVSGLIVLVRNYKECLARVSYLAYQKENPKSIFKDKNITPLLNTITTGDANFGNPQAIGDNLAAYMSIIEYFDKFKGPKTLIHYEDLIKEPKEFLLKTCSLLSKVSPIKYNLDLFINNLDYHKQRSLKLYPKNPHNTAGNKQKLTQHSKAIFTPKQIWEIDTFIESKYPNLYSKYLSRYK